MVFADSPNNTLRVAVIGMGGQKRDLKDGVPTGGLGRGGAHLSGWAGPRKEDKNAEVVAICDIDDVQLAKGFKTLDGYGAKKPTAYKDIRKVIDNKDIDVLSIATPNHWHTLMTIWGVQGGKDVYVEKPCSHNIFEARQIVAATRKYDRIVQQGSQIRSSLAVQNAMKQIRDGLIGDVYLSRGLCYKWRDDIGHAPAEPVPAGVDYDMWNGPAPVHAFTKNRFHYNWHWFWDTATAIWQPGHSPGGYRALGFGREISDQGKRHRRPFHVRRRPGNAQHAKLRVGVQRGRQAQDDGVRSASLDDERRIHRWAAEAWRDGQQRIAECGKWRGAGGARGRQGRARRGRGGAGGVNSDSIGALFYGSKGYLDVDSYSSYKSFLGRAGEPGPAENKGGGHFANFAEAVRKHDRNISERRDRGWSGVHHSGSPGEYLVSPRTDDQLRSQYVEYHWRCGSGEDDDAALSRRDSWFRRRSRQLSTQEYAERVR